MFVVAAIAGSVAGFYGGWADTVVSRLTDVFLGFPFLLGAIIILTVFSQRTVWTISGVLALFAWPTGARLVRSTVLTARQADYVVAARALGARDSRLLFRHVLPNAITPLLVLCTLLVGGIIAAEAGADVPRGGSAAPGDLLGAAALDLPGLPGAAPAPACCSRRRCSASRCSASSCSATRCRTPSTRTAGDAAPRGRRPAGRVPQPDGGRCGRSTGCPTPSSRARPWRWWASRARGKSVDRAGVMGILDTPPGGIAGGADPLPRRDLLEVSERAAARGPRPARSRWSSRTR